MADRLSRDQYEFLTGAIQAARVQHLRGNAHLEQWDIRRHLIRAFGFGGFDIETKSIQCVAQIEHKPTEAGGKSRWTVVYTAEVRLTVKSTNGVVLAVYEDGASGDSQNQPSLGDAHDQALKTALSQGLKRCAVNLGDQFGLSLYNGGKTAPVVHRSLVVPDSILVTHRIDHADEPVQPEPAPDAEQVPEQAEEPPVTQAQHKRMHALWRELGYVDKDQRLAITAKIIGLEELATSAHLTVRQAAKVIDALEKKKREQDQPQEAA